MTLANIRSALEARGCRPRGNGQGIKALCPSCQLDGPSHSPALSVMVGNSQPVVFHCHGPGSCGGETVISALGMVWSDVLTDHPASVRSCAQSKSAPTAPDENVSRWQDFLWRNEDRLQFLRNERGLSDSVILAARLGWDGERYTIPILNSDHSVLYVRRYSPGGEPKYSTPKGATAALYGAETLPGLKDDSLVLVCEGELDALRCRTLGYTAISGTAGAKTWRQDWSKALARFECVVIGDHDDDGWTMNRKVTESLRAAGAYTQVLQWPEGMPAKCDPTDYLREHQAGKFRELVEAALDAGRLQAVELTDLLTQHEVPIPWAIPNWLARKELVAFVGEPKQGKSTAAQDLAVALATGGRWLDHLQVSGGPYRVLYLDEENPPALIRRRLGRTVRAHGLSQTNLAELPLRYLNRNRLNLSQDDRLQALWREVRAFRPDFVIFDSLVRFHGRDENSNSEMAQFYAEVFSPLMSHYGAGIVALHHLSKPGQNRAAGDIMHRVRGASSILSDVDELWSLEGKPDGSRHLCHQLTRWDDTAPELTLTLTLGDRLQAEDAEAVAKEIILEALEDAGDEGLLREAVVKTVEAAGFKERVATKHLGQLHSLGRLKKRRDGRPMRYWLTPCAPEDAE